MSFFSLSLSGRTGSHPKKSWSRLVSSVYRIALWSIATFISCISRRMPSRLSILFFLPCNISAPANRLRQQPQTMPELFFYNPVKVYFAQHVFDLVSTSAATKLLAGSINFCRSRFAPFNTRRAPREWFSIRTCFRPRNLHSSICTGNHFRRPTLPQNICLQFYFI